RAKPREETPSYFGSRERELFVRGICISEHG
ncbi:hypothetical protein VCHENC02_4090B, partial [Vibrio harveyi]